MARLSANQRKNLPDTAFAYVDSSGKRRLPINDESHVRNALSRFGQVPFETENARDIARRRLLNSAKRHGIVPVGFIEGELRTVKKKSAPGRLIIELGRINSSSELQSELRRTLGDKTLQLLQWSKSEGTYIGCDGSPVALPVSSASQETTFLQGRGRPLMAILHDQSVLKTPEITEAVMAAVHLVAGKELLEEIDELGVATVGLPGGEVTFLLTDIESSTFLLQALNRRYPRVLTDVRKIIRECVLKVGGRQVEARADEYVAVFASAPAAVDAAAQMQLAIAAHIWPDDHRVRIRAGIHTGEIILTDSGYVGLTVHTAARIMSAAHGGQILLSGATQRVLGSERSETTQLLGRFQLRGLNEQHDLFQLNAPGLESEFAEPAI